jgi:hypothetical protein
LTNKEDSNILVGRVTNATIENLKGGERMKIRIWRLAALLAFFTFVLSGCNYFAARDQIKGAEMSFNELKGQGGAKLAPYEYCSAEKFLEASRGEFVENDFKAAIEFAKRSKSAADTGLAEVKKGKK